MICSTGVEIGRDSRFGRAVQTNSRAVFLSLAAAAGAGLVFLAAGVCGAQHSGAEIRLFVLACIDMSSKPRNLLRRGFFVQKNTRQRACRLRLRRAQTTGDVLLIYAKIACFVLHIAAECGKIIDMRPGKARKQSPHGRGNAIR